MQQSRHWQATASHERCSASCERHNEIRPRSETAPSCWAALARCGRSGHVQALYDSVKVYSQHSPGLYLSELSTSVAQVAERQHLCSASRRLLVVPRIQLDTYGRRAFAMIGPTVWNALSNDLRDPELNTASFGRLLKTHLFQQYSVYWAH